LDSRKMRKIPYTDWKRGKNYIRNSTHDGRLRRESERERKKMNATNGGTVRIGGGGEVAYNNMLIAEDRGRQAHI
jgi:hypothetical protein